MAPRNKIVAADPLSDAIADRLRDLAKRIACTYDMRPASRAEWDFASAKDPISRSFNATPTSQAGSERSPARRIGNAKGRAEARPLN